MSLHAPMGACMLWGCAHVISCVGRGRPGGDMVPKFSTDYFFNPHLEPRDRPWSPASADPCGEAPQPSPCPLCKSCCAVFSTQALAVIWEVLGCPESGSACSALAKALTQSRMKAAPVSPIHCLLCIFCWQTHKAEVKVAVSAFTVVWIEGTWRPGLGVPAVPSRVQMAAAALLGPRQQCLRARQMAAVAMASAVAAAAFSCLLCWNGPVPIPACLPGTQRPVLSSCSPNQQCLGEALLAAELLSTTGHCSSVQGGGHAGLLALALPPSTGSCSRPILAGRWPRGSAVPESSEIRLYPAKSSSLPLLSFSFSLPLAAFPPQLTHRLPQPSPDCTGAGRALPVFWRRPVSLDPLTSLLCTNIILATKAYTSPHTWILYEFLIISTQVQEATLPLWACFLGPQLLPGRWSLASLSVCTTVHRDSNLGLCFMPSTSVFSLLQCSTLLAMSLPLQPGEGWGMQLHHHFLELHKAHLHSVGVPPSGRGPPPFLSHCSIEVGWIGDAMALTWKCYVPASVNVSLSAVSSKYAATDV